MEELEDALMNLFIQSPLPPVMKRCAVAKFAQDVEDSYRFIQLCEQSKMQPQNYEQQNLKKD